MATRGRRRVLHFSHAYGYAAAVAQLLRRPDGEAELADWIDVKSPAFRGSLSGPQRRSVLHDLIGDLAFHDWEHEVSHWRVDSLVGFFRDHGEDLNEGRDSDASRERMWRRLKNPISKLTDAAFNILFADRATLLCFNRLLADLIKKLPGADHPELTQAGTAHRPSHLPAWLRRAVYYRDQGRCQLCGCDLTGLIDPLSRAELDHLWPLARHGSNDATNFQLLCRACNGRKGHGPGVTSDHYSPYW